LGGVTGISVSGSPSITGLVNITGINGYVVILSGNSILFSGGGGAGMTAEPEPYMAMEMSGGFGDSYSFLGVDTSAQGDGGMSMKHNFTYLNGSDSVSTREASSFQTTSSNQKRSKKEELLDQQMEQYMKSRDTGIPQRIARQ
jgi:hypothetical protein